MIQFPVVPGCRSRIVIDRSLSRVGSWAPLTHGTIATMRIGTLRRGRASETAPGVTGTARGDRRTKNLTQGAGPGEDAVHAQGRVGRVSADSLVAGKVAAVVNAAPST